MLPKDGNGNYIGHPMPFHRSMVLFPGESALDTKYEVHALHSRLDYNELKIMMRPNATFVTILRDPASLFESMYTYSELVKSYYLDLDTFAINAAAALNKSEFPGHYLTFDFSRRFSSGITGRNQMSFDLGLDSVFHDDELAIQGFIAHIDRVFDLVMISERMDESLVLLKHLLCLPMEDVVVFKHNSRRNEFKHQVDDYTNEKLKLVNHADTKLYEHFVSKFDERVKQFGHERMKKEVLKLKQLTDQMYAKCVEAEIEKPLGKFVFSDKTLSFEAKSSTGLTCKQLTLNELEYLDRLRTKMGTVKEFKMDVPK
ncbi:Galactosylceramide sulfotransferase [Halotydeus destructor]|nr:Galactosylceramide sulfotransferase [Halotydeus destructor]